MTRRDIIGILILCALLVAGIFLAAAFVDREASKSVGKTVGTVVSVATDRIVEVVKK